MTPPFGYVYALTNRVTGQVYIGQTRIRPLHRWHVHKSEAKTRPRLVLHAAINKFGPDAFDLTVLATADDLATLRQLEETWILRTRSHTSTRGYNIAIGYKMAPETRAKMIANRTGKSLSGAHRAAVSAAMTGKRKSPEHCAALRAARLRVVARERALKAP